MVRIREATLGRVCVTVEPFEELLAVRRNDVGLRIMDVRVDEPREDQLVAVIDDERS